MADDYTPTTEEVREDFAFPWSPEQIGDRPARVAAFDRWLAQYTAEKRAEWETEFLQNATVRVEYRDFETGPYSDSEPQSRRIIKTPWVPVNENGSER